MRQRGPEQHREGPHESELKLSYLAIAVHHHLKALHDSRSSLGRQAAQLFKREDEKGDIVSSRGLKDTWLPEESRRLADQEPAGVSVVTGEGGAYAQDIFEVRNRRLKRILG